MITTDDELDRCGPPEAVLRSEFLRGCRFEVRSISQTPPPPFAVSIMYRRDGDHLNQVGVGCFKDGKWTNSKGRELDPVGLYWTAMVDEH